jgi:hypothetical protein
LEQPRWRGDGRFAQEDLCDIDQRLTAGAFIAKRFVLRFDPDVYRLVMDGIMIAAGGQRDAVILMAPRPALDALTVAH